MDHILFGVCLKFVRGVSTGTLLVPVVGAVLDRRLCASPSHGETAARVRRDRGTLLLDGCGVQGPAPVRGQVRKLGALAS